MNSNLNQDSLAAGSLQVQTPSLIISSTAASVCSDSDYQNSPVLPVSRPPSRPLSRCSTTSGLSTTATKDGVEGKRIHRVPGFQPYTTSLLSSYSPHVYNNDSKSISSTNTEDSTNYSTTSTNNQTPNIPTAPPFTLNDKIRLLRTGHALNRNNDTDSTSEPRNPSSTSINTKPTDTISSKDLEDDLSLLQSKNDMDKEAQLARVNSTTT